MPLALPVTIATLPFRSPIAHLLLDSKGKFGHWVDHSGNPPNDRTDNLSGVR
jgi:hypothetical protein